MKFKKLAVRLLIPAGVFLLLLGISTRIPLSKRYEFRANTRHFSAELFSRTLPITTFHITKITVTGHYSFLFDPYKIENLPMTSLWNNFLIPEKQYQLKFESNKDGSYFKLQGKGNTFTILNISPPYKFIISTTQNALNFEIIADTLHTEINWGTGGNIELRDLILSIFSNKCNSKFDSLFLDSVVFNYDLRMVSPNFQTSSIFYYEKQKSANFSFTSLPNGIEDQLSFNRLETFSEPDFNYKDTPEKFGKSAVISAEMKFNNSVWINLDEKEISGVRLQFYNKKKWTDCFLKYNNTMNTIEVHLSGEFKVNPINGEFEFTLFDFITGNKIIAIFISIIMFLISNMKTVLKLFGN